MIRTEGKFKFPKHMPHLEGSLRLIGHKGPGGGGMCFHRSIGLVLDVPQARLMVGTFRAATPEECAANPLFSPVPFIHCWTMIGNKIYAPTTYEGHGHRLVPMDPEAYYERNGARDIVGMNRATVLRLSKKYGLAQHLVYFTPLKGQARFADVILDELGISHVTHKNGGVIPGVGGDEPL
jgi:hypothetical protein